MVSIDIKPSLLYDNTIPIVFLGKVFVPEYYEELKTITNCDKDKRIRILPGIYDETKLSTIRKNSFLYLHGHSVGGTNPSLLEAMSLTDLNLLFDNVNFKLFCNSVILLSSINSFFKINLSK